ncbi:hypothetical protein ABI59_14365 [Acidobacteria bacterium Mor1]|nr:hypothetical protein ABI59_14365 [Acidobacteria bacterium Mor1]
MQRNYRLFLILALASALLAGLPAMSASPARIPVYEPGTTISTPGDYVLTRDLSNSSGPVITITADGVDLDLGGFTLNGTSAAQDVIFIDGATAGTQLGVALRNGRLDGGLSSVYSGAGFARRVVLEDLVAVNAAGPALYINGGRHVTMRRCRVENSAGDGMLILNLAGTALSVELEHNVVLAAARNGIRTQNASGGHIRDNQVFGVGTAALANDAGIKLAATGPGAGGVLIEDNVVRDGAGSANGIWVESNNVGVTLRGNLLENNAATGLFVAGDRCRAQHNTIVGNGGNGAGFQGDNNLIEDNFIAGNANGLICGGPVEANFIKNNVMRVNGADQYRCDFSFDLGGNFF